DAGVIFYDCFYIMRQEYLAMEFYLYRVIRFEIALLLLLLSSFVLNAFAGNEAPYAQYIKKTNFVIP
ncbi:hypothetical protein, partial [Xenorhabdus bovienii]|uniref:hypothetical protein n=1 Tax=Xenorhabdus bovienii TaxID=40576 RepID=UPI003DA1F00F